MQKQCQKCRKKVSDELFICPHCGAILGDPVRKPAPVPKRAKAPKERKPRRSHAFAWIGPVLMLLVVVSLALMLPKYLRQSASNTETTAPTYTTNAPLVTYNVQVKASDRTTMKGVMIEIYLGDRMIDSCITGQYGKASFTLPQNADYRLRLKELPTKYQIIYGETDFTFPEGQQDLIISLENKPIPYIVKVVNEDGEPLQGACVKFYKPVTSSTQMITDEYGCCVFEALYLETGYFVRFHYPPTGYAYILQEFHFDEGSNELVIMLPTIGETVSDGKVLYTVRVVDEYGQPVTNTLVYALEDDPYAAITGSYNIGASGSLNQDGWFAFVGDVDQTYIISLPQMPDYSEVYFRFEENSRELQIQLDLERDEYVYTVYVVDYWGNPNPGVEVFYQNPDGSGEDIPYVSDENGIITITCNEPDPTKVVLYRVEEDGAIPERRVYTFLYNSRKLKISVYKLYEDRVYTVKVQDQNGQPVVGVILVMNNFMGQTQYAESNQDGICVFYFEHCVYDLDRYWVCIDQLPDGYTNPSISPQPFENDSREMTLTVIATTEPIE